MHQYFEREFANTPMRNPLDGIKISSKKKETIINPKDIIFNGDYKAVPKEIRKQFLEALDKDIRNHFLKPLCYLMYYTGNRIGETLAYQWKDFNFDRRYFLVYKAVTMEYKFDENGNKIGKGKTIVKSPKTSKSIRPLPILDILYEVLIEWYEFRKAQEKLSGTVEKQLVGAVAGDYTLKVTAKGNGSAYTDSDAKSITITVLGQTGSGEKTEVTLELTGLEYDNTTKIASWNKTANASGYSLRVGSSTKQSTDITESGGKMQYTMTESSNGTYNVFVKALGSETATHIYKTSDEVKVIANYTTTLVQKTESQLQTPTIGFDGTSGIVYWNTVSNANGYTLLINDSAKTGTYSATNSRMEYQLEGYGAFTAKVKALGGNENETTVYTDSAQATYSGNWQQSGGEPSDKTYADIETLVEQKAEAVWKEKNTFMASSFAGIEVKGINLEDGIAYLNISRTTGDVYAVTFTLGNLGNSLADICEYINDKNYIAADMSSNTEIQSQENTTLLVNALISRGKITGNVIWATATNFGGAGTKAADVTVALDNGSLVIFTLAITTQSSGSK